MRLMSVSIVAGKGSEAVIRDRPKGRQACYDGRLFKDRNSGCEWRKPPFHFEHEIVFTAQSELPDIAADGVSPAWDSRDTFRQPDQDGQNGPVVMGLLERITRVLRSVEIPVKLSIRALSENPMTARH